MNKAQLYKKLSRLESVHDLLLTELEYIDHLMKVVGFANGTSSLKKTAEEMVLKGLIETHQE
jgi:hypothetical protein